jgi:hypothetical protein
VKTSGPIESRNEGRRGKRSQYSDENVYPKESEKSAGQVRAFGLKVFNVMILSELGVLFGENR